MENVIEDYIIRTLKRKKQQALEEILSLNTAINKLNDMVESPRIKEYQVYVESDAGWVDKPARAFNADLAKALAEAECEFIEMYGASIRYKFNVTALMGDAYPNQELISLPKELWEPFLRSQPNGQATSN